MKELGYNDFVEKLGKANSRKPLYGQIELTYNCPNKCIHCYCKNQTLKELDVSFWKDVIDQVRALGGMEITFTGGDPLFYHDFCEIYKYTKEKGFLVNVFTSGYPVNNEILTLFKKFPPLNIEITLNSLEKGNYAKITGTNEKYFDVVMNNILALKKARLPLVLKCNGLKENKAEILQIKKFTQNLLGKGNFKFDSFIFPGLNCESEIKLHRLDPQEIKDIELNDEDMLAQRIKQSKNKGDWFNPKGLYHCNSWFSRFYISPEGLLQFCHLTKDFSTDLKKKTFKEGFDSFLDVLNVKPKTNSKCWSCDLLEYCYRCPARAFLETGDQESPVEYYCRLAEISKTFMEQLSRSK
ncbi:MAG: radical SAM protein [Candidatus Omnitrophota bacterium]